MQLSVAKIHEFATTVDVETLDIIKQSVEVNSIIAGEGMKNDYGLMIGKSMEKEIKEGIRAYDCINYSMMIAAAAADARMAGADFSVVTNSGSGNQGISSSVPAIAIAEYMGKNREEMLRAVTISSLMAIYIKAQFGKLSAFCGATVAASGTAAAITYMLGGSNKQIKAAINNLGAGIAGMLCDGAKMGCAVKVACAASAALDASALALNNVEIPGDNGILSSQAELTMQNIATVCNEGMPETDNVILKVMLNRT